MDLIAQAYAGEQEEDEGKQQPVVAKSHVQQADTTLTAEKVGDANRAASTSSEYSDSYESSSYEYSSSDESDESDDSDKDSNSSSEAAEMLDSIIKSKGWEALNQIDSDEDENKPPATLNETIPEPPTTIDVKITDDDVVVEAALVTAIIENTVVATVQSDQATYDIGTVLCILSSENIPLGEIDEVFGPVKAPMYTIRCDTASFGENLKVGVKLGALQRLSSEVVAEKLYTKGYDNSGKHDEEVAREEDDFSDDEKEREARKLRTQKKRNVRGKNKQSVQYPGQSIAPAQGHSTAPTQMVNYPYPYYPQQYMYNNGYHNNNYY